MSIVKKISAKPRAFRSVLQVPGLHEYRDVVQAFAALGELEHGRIGEALSLAIVRGAGGYIEEDEIAACVSHLLTPQSPFTSGSFMFQLDAIRRVLDGSLIIRRGPKTANTKLKFLLLSPDGS